jgi:hypothetical protein
MDISEAAADEGWVQCDRCSKWRPPIDGRVEKDGDDGGSGEEEWGGVGNVVGSVTGVVDDGEQWFCEYHPNPRYASCDAPVKPGPMGNAYQVTRMPVHDPRASAKRLRSPAGGWPQSAREGLLHDSEMRRDAGLTDSQTHAAIEPMSASQIEGQLPPSQPPEPVAMEEEFFPPASRKKLRKSSCGRRGGGGRGSRPATPARAKSPLKYEVLGPQLPEGDSQRPEEISAAADEEGHPIGDECEEGARAAAAKAANAKPAAQAKPAAPPRRNVTTNIKEEEEEEEDEEEDGHDEEYDDDDGESDEDYDDDDDDDSDYELDLKSRGRRRRTTPAPAAKRRRSPP